MGTKKLDLDAIWIVKLNDPDAIDLPVSWWRGPFVNSGKSGIKDPMKAKRFNTKREAESAIRSIYDHTSKATIPMHLSMVMESSRIAESMQTQPVGEVTIAAARGRNPVSQRIVPTPYEERVLNMMVRDLMHASAVARVAKRQGNTPEDFIRSVVRHLYFGPANWRTKFHGFQI